jgi:hypothetical protein
MWIFFPHLREEALNPDLSLENLLSGSGPYKIISDLYPDLINNIRPGSGPFKIISFLDCNPLATGILLILSSVADPGCLSRIRDPDFYPSRISDPGSRIPDLGSLISDLGSRIPDPWSRITKQHQKRGMKKNLLSFVFFVATNFTKLIIILVLKCWRKKFGSLFKEL